MFTFDHSFFAGKNLLVTGAAGTVGRALIRALMPIDLSHLVAMDNNETEIFFLEQEYGHDPRFRAGIGDIRDPQSIRHLSEEIDIVLHAAALKHVGVCEKAPFDAVQTNIIGINNLIVAAVANRIERVVFMSSDKAVNPTNVMGTSKLMGERLVTAANSLRRTGYPVFTSTRFGNVLGSRGSVLEIFKNQIKAGGPVTLTDSGMSRFVMTENQSVDLVLEATALAHGGEVFVTKMPVMRIKDLAQAMVDMLAPAYGYDPAAISVNTVGVRTGEKLYEELLNEEEVRRTMELQNHFVILPAFRALYASIDYEFNGVVREEVDRPYRSDQEKTLSQSEIRSFLANHNLVQLP
jgi:FlaA1/EpsC-like NDP-sugar epimerase